MKWQDIGSAPEDRIILVCDERNGMPWTIAKVERGAFAWWYAGSDEPIDFDPVYWIERDIEDNPFHMPLPTPQEPPHAG